MAAIFAALSASRFAASLNVSSSPPQMIRPSGPTRR
jgi:hypothetical protein